MILIPRLNPDVNHLSPQAGIHLLDRRKKTFRSDASLTLGSGPGFSMEQGVRLHHRVHAEEPSFRPPATVWMTASVLQTTRKSTIALCSQMIILSHLRRKRRLHGHVAGSTGKDPGVNCFSRAAKGLQRQRRTTTHTLPR